MKGSISKHSDVASGRKARCVLVIAAALALALSALVFAGCSCSAQSSASASASSSSASAGQVEVPNLVGLKQADVEKKLAEAQLAIGTVTREYSETVAEGLIISQKPEALSKAESGTKVDIVVSQGKKAPEQVTVPDVVGKTQTEAEKMLADAKLVVVVGDPIESTDVDPGKVCKQSVAAGTTVEEGSKVTIQTALGKQDVKVPDVVGKAQADAKAELEKAGLGCDTATAYSDTVAKDNVISQSIPAGTSVVKGTAVVLQISLGAKPAQKVAVPDIMTYTLDHAQKALESAGLGYRYSGDEDGTVVSVDPAVGTEVEVGSTVAFTLQKQVKTVEVPDVSGMTGTKASQAVEKAGLYLDFDSDNPDRKLEGTNPAAGTVVEEGTTVVAVYPVNPDPDPNTWVAAKNASEAAKGSGIDQLDVEGSISLAGISFSAPSYAYKKHAIQAEYDSPATMVVVRKGEGVSLSTLDGDLGSYSKSWTQNHKGLNIKCYGKAKDKATLIEWKIGNTRYVAAILGLGGETMSMTPDEVTSLVSGIQ